VREEIRQPIRRVVKPLGPPKQYPQAQHPQLRMFKDDLLRNIRAEIENTKRELLAALA